MQIGEVLGDVDCGVRNKDLRGLKLKVVRLYSSLGRPDKVIVAGDSNVRPGNGDFVVLVQSSMVDYTITDFVGENISLYMDTRINMKIS